MNRQVTNKFEITDYKARVDEAKRKLKKQIAILGVAAFGVTVAIFLIFFWTIQV